MELVQELFLAFLRHHCQTDHLQYHYLLPNQYLHDNKKMEMMNVEVIIQAQE